MTGRLAAAIDCPTRLVCSFGKLISKDSAKTGFSS